MGEREERMIDDDYQLMEKSRDSNLIAFTHFLLGTTLTSITETTKVLREDPENLVALANKAVFLWLTGDRPHAESLRDELEDLKTSIQFNERVTLAKAEMAYCYSRMGVPYASLAISLFEEVVKEKPEEYDWKLGLALTLRRFATSFNLQIYHDVNTENMKAKVIKSQDLLLDVIRKADAPNLQAQAYAELGRLLLAPCEEAVSKALKAHSCGLRPGDCFEKVLKSGTRNLSVLTYVSVFFRKLRNHEASLRALSLALKIRETSVVHCGLACTYHMKVRLEKGLAKSESTKKAIEHFKRSIELAHGQNAIAHYRLGLLYKESGDLEAALKEFKAILRCQQSSSPMEIVNAYRQCGRISLELSKRERDDNKRKKYGEEGPKLLHIALDMLCRSSARVPALGPFFKKTWRSLNSLITTAFKHKPEALQLTEEARLLYMIKDNEGVLEVLDQLAKIPEKQFQKEEITEMQLNSYIRAKKFEDAVTFVRLLDVTEQKDQPELWRNKSLPLQTYILAARHNLLRATKTRDDIYNLQTDIACKYFRWAFERKYFPYASETKSADRSEKADTQCADSGERSNTQSVECGDDVDTHNEKDDDGSESPLCDYWHVMILHDPHDPSMQAAASKVKATLKEDCGLNVTCMSDDVLGGRPELFSVHENMEKTCLLVVMAGSDNLSHEFSDGYLAPARDILMTDKSSRCHLVVITSGATQRPKELRGYRSFPCPEGLLAEDPEGVVTEGVVTSACEDRKLKDICDLFCSLVDTSIDLFEQTPAL